MRNREEIKELIDRILAKTSAEHVDIEFGYGSNLATRFGDNAITQNMSGKEEILRLVTAFGKKHGSSITNKMDDASIEKLVTRAEGIAKTSPEDPEYMPPIEPQKYPEVPKRFYQDVVDITPQQLAAEIRKTIDTAKGDGYNASGLFETNHTIKAIANNRGMFAFDQSTNIEYSTTIHGEKGSGHAFENSETLAGVDAGRMAKRALGTAIAAQNPVDIEPGDYTVIFEPLAVIDILGFLAWNMSARDADEGTTAFSGKVGEKLFSDKINITTEIDDPELPVPYFGMDGLASKRIEWVKNGVLKRLRHDRFWAAQKGEEPDPHLYPIFIGGENKSVADLIASCKNGLLVKRLWYIRYVDRKELLLTGMTRDGFFRIRDGKVTEPVKNLRWNESPIVFLNNVLALSRPEIVGSWAKVPAIMSEGFTFSSKTESL